jgi:hypothetical protein
MSSRYVQRRSYLLGLSLLFVLLIVGGQLLLTRPAKADVEGRPCNPEPTNMFIGYGDLITCSIDPSGDTDVFRFQGSTQEVISIQLTYQSGAGRPCLELFDPAGLLVGSHCPNAFSARIDKRLESTGVFTIRVSAWNNGTMGYALSVERLAPPSASAVPLRFNQNLADEINPVGDIDLYFLNGAVNDLVTIQLTYRSGSGRPCLELFDPAGVLLDSHCPNAFSARLDKRLESTGIFTIRVSAWNNGTMGYNVDLQCVGQCSSPTPCPNVSSLSPTSGPVGTVATITGNHFTGVTAVRFSNNVAANFTVNSSGTQITTTVPSGAVTGPISISKPNCPDTPTPSFTVSQCIALGISSSLTGGASSTIAVPINTGDLTGRGVFSYDLTLGFNPSVLRPANPPFDSSETVSSGMTITANTGTPGRLTLSAFGTLALSGAGRLLKLRFELIGPSQACSELNWISFRFNEGSPCATTFTPGRVCIIPAGLISGTVNYCISPKAVPGVVVTAAGTPPKMNTTDNAGNYQLTELGSGSYVVTPTKTGNINGISSFDASLVAQHAAGLITLTSCQQLAGDASNNGSLSSFDASLIAQFSAGLPNTGSVGTWKFVPPNRNYPSVTGNLGNQNFEAMLVGDVSGNWSPSASGLLLTTELQPTLVGEVAQAAISLPNISGARGSSVTIPITVGNLTERGYVAYDFDLTFDQNVLQLQNPPVDAAGTLSSALNLTPNATTPGRLRVSAFGTSALAGVGTLLNLKFNVIGTPGSATALTWQSFFFNEAPQTNLTAGRFTVSGLANPPTLTATPSTVAPGDLITVSWNWNVPGGQSATDWVGLYRAGAADDAFLDWKSTNGTPLGSTTFLAPIQPGAYVFRYFLADSFNRAAQSNVVTVELAYFLTATPSTIAPNDSLTVCWRAPNGRSAKDWVGLYPSGSSSGSFLWWQYTQGAVSGCFTLNVPTQAGQYEARYCLDDGYEERARSNVVTVSTTPLAQASNKSTPTACAEEDNVNICFTGRVASFSLEATPPAYPLASDNCAPDSSNCPAAPPGFPFTSDVFKLFDDGETVVEAVREASWWRPLGMLAGVNDRPPVADIHYLRLYRRIAGTSEYPQILVLYSDGNLRLIPQPPAGSGSVCFGSSIIIGAAAPAARPLAEISSVTYFSSTQTLEIKYKEGGTARIVLREVLRNLTRVQVIVNYPTEALPWATFRSMFVSEDNADVERVKWLDAAGVMRDEPVMAFAGGLGTEWFFYRQTRSRHNISAPNLRIRLE